MDDGDLNWSVNVLFNDVADLDNDGDFSREFNNVRNLHNFFVEFFDFVYLGNLVVDNNDFLNNSWHLNHSISGLDDWFSDFSLNLLDNFVNVRGDLFDLSKHISDDWFFNCSIDLFNSHLLNFNLNDSFNFLNNLDNLLDVSVDSNDLFNNTVYWDWYFNGDNGGFFDFDDFLYFNNFRNNSFDFDFSWYFNSNFNNLF